MVLVTEGKEDRVCHMMCAVLLTKYQYMCVCVCVCNACVYVVCCSVCIVECMRVAYVRVCVLCQSQ